MRKIISLILICSMLIAILTGCSYFDKTNEDGNEAGDVEAGNNNSEENDERDSGPCGIEVYYWVETHEELVEAVEILKANGNIIIPSLIFDCEGMMLEGNEVDVKYCLATCLEGRSKKEDSFLDLKGEEISIDWYLCDRPTSIKVGESNLINYSNERLMKENLIFYSTGGMAEEEKLKDLIIEDKELLMCGLDGLYIDSGLDDYPYPHDSAWYWFRVVYMGEELGEFYSPEGKYPTFSSLPKEFMNELVKTLVILDWE